MSTPFLILSIDGGGFRGLFAAHILRRIEELWKIKWFEKFQMFAGTSTGSIIAAGLAAGLSAAELSEFYIAHGQRIFTKRKRARFDLPNLFTSRYSADALKECLKDVFGDRKLGDIKIPLILPSVDIRNGCVHVFKSKYDDSFCRDPGIYLADAVQASCSAPTYFDPHTLSSQYQLTDGGLWANNPSLIAAIEAHARLNIPLDDIRILSIGTGKSKVFYRNSAEGLMSWLAVKLCGWGFVTRWGRARFIDFILNLQSDTAQNLVSLLLKEKQEHPRSILRLNFESDLALSLDSFGLKDEWLSRADRVFTENSEKIKRFINC